jgi:hypothetical protein
VSGAKSDDLTNWSGWDLRKRERQADNAIAGSDRPVSDGNGGEQRYELLAVAARGFRPPQFLSSRDVTVESAGLDGDESQPPIPGVGDLRLTWSVLYRRIASTNPEATELPYAIYLLGVNPPPEASTEELEVFNDFYTNVHLVEVAERRNAIRATRYELVRELRAPYPSAPRFLASYEVDEASAAKRRHIGPPYSTGPEIWQGHKTPWRLWYRRLEQADQEHTVV